MLQRPHSGSVEDHIVFNRLLAGDGDADFVGLTVIGQGYHRMFGFHIDCRGVVLWPTGGSEMALHNICDFLNAAVDTPPFLFVGSLEVGIVDDGLGERLIEQTG